MESSLTRIRSSSMYFCVPVNRIRLLVSRSRMGTTPIQYIKSTQRRAKVSIFPPSRPNSIRRNSTYRMQTLRTIATVNLFGVSPLSRPTISRTRCTFQDTRIVKIGALFCSIPFICLRRLFRNFLELDQLFATPGVRGGSIPAISGEWGSTLFLSFILFCNAGNKE